MHLSYCYLKLDKLESSRKCLQQSKDIVEVEEGSPIQTNLIMLESQLLIKEEEFSLAISTILPLVGSTNEAAT